MIQMIKHSANGALLYLLQNGKILLKGECPKYNTKPHLVVILLGSLTQSVELHLWVK